MGILDKFFGKKGGSGGAAIQIVEETLDGILAMPDLIYRTISTRTIAAIFRSKFWKRSKRPCR